jgi:1,4-alpha-glucan branching enzyme
MKQTIPAGKAVPADWLSHFDRYLISEGTHERAYEKLGAHLVEFEGKKGAVFAVWAPNARQVSVVGDFNGWDPAAHPMHSSDAGIWSLFIPRLPEFSVYKYRQGRSFRLLHGGAAAHRLGGRRPGPLPVAGP